MNKYKLIKKKKITKHFFPREKEVDMNKIRMTKESLYSTTPPEEAEKITQIIIKYMDKSPLNSVLTDGTSNVGGNVLNFSKHFKTVNAVEMDNTTFNALRNNMNVYKRNNINFYNNDYTKVMNELKQDVIFMDPPWGGPSYKLHKHLNLYLSNISIGTIVGQLKDKAHLIAVKVPLNFNYNAFIKEAELNNIYVYKIRKYALIIVKQL